MAGPRVRYSWRTLGWLLLGVGVTLVLPRPAAQGRDGVTIGADGIITQDADGTDAATFPYDLVAHNVVQVLRSTPELPGWEGFPYVEGVVGSTWVGERPERADARGLVALAARQWREIGGLSGIDEWVYDFGESTRAAAAAAGIRAHGRLFSGTAVHDMGGVLRGADHVLLDGVSQTRQYWVLVEGRYVYVLGLQSHTPTQWWPTLSALSQERFGRDVVSASLSGGAEVPDGVVPEPVTDEGAAAGSATSVMPDTASVVVEPGVPGGAP